MAMQFHTTDLILTGLTAVGIFQVAWLSAFLTRKGQRPTVIQQMVRPMVAIWVLMWPVYVDANWIWPGLAILASPLLLGMKLEAPFWLALRSAWSVPPHQRGNLPQPMHMLPMFYFFVALVIAAAFFMNIPEFGLGLGLCLCLGFPGAEILDRLHRMPLGFPTHPNQTLPGHLLLITLCTIALSWSIHVFHGIDWQPSLIATLIAGIVASICRAIIPGGLNQATAIFAMGVTLWLL